MKAIEGQLKALKNQNSQKISSALRNKIDRYHQLVKEMVKNSNFKIVDDIKGQKMLSSINREIQNLKKDIQSQIKVDMTDYQAFIWKTNKINQIPKPLFFDNLSDLTHTQKNHNIQEIKKNFEFPILNCKVKELIKLTSDLLSTNKFCQQNFSRQMLINLCSKLSSGYKITSYHNFSHAFSVFLMIFQCRESSDLLQNIYSPFQYFVTYIAALAHDINHSGFNSIWEIKNSSQIALRYNNQSVLENMHISELYKIFRQYPQIDIISKMKSFTQRQNAKRLINRLILATDVGYHQKHLKELISISQVSDHRSLSETDKSIILENLFHACDIGNPCLGYSNYFNWSILLAYEFNNQAVLQRQNQFQVSMNFQYIDIETHYRRQVGFIDFLAHPLWKQICVKIPQLDFLEKKLQRNREILIEKSKMKG